MKKNRTIISVDTAKQLKDWGCDIESDYLCGVFLNYESGKEEVLSPFDNCIFNPKNR